MAQYDINLREYWRILRKRKLIVIITAILLMLFSTIYSILNAPIPLYTSSCSIKFEREPTLEGLYARTLSWSGTDDIETQISVITGYPVLMEIAKNLSLIPQGAEIVDPKIVAAVDRLKSKLHVQRESYTNILDIMVTDPAPLFAQRLANEVAVTYKRIHAEQQGKRTIDALNYIDDQLKKVRQKFKDAEEEFNNYSQSNQLISIDLQSENLLIRKKEIGDEIRKQNDMKSELKAVLVRVENFIKNPSSSDTNFYATNASPQYQATNNSLVELLLKRDTLLENYTSQHPEVVAVGFKIIENARKMVLLLKIQMDNIEKKKAELVKELEEVDRKTNHLMEKKLEFDRLKREVDFYRGMTADLEKKNQEALIRKAEKPEEVVIVKPASFPTRPINPPKHVATGFMGMMIGIVLGLVLAFVIETFDTSLGTIEDVEETLGAKVLGVIPHADAKEIIGRIKDRYPKGIDEYSEKTIINLVSHFAPKTMISESFRALRTNIHFREGENKIKTIAITSTSPQEGKTMVSANLAISLAQAGLKTLLVGSDLRKPMLAKIFGLEISPGLTDIILGSYSWSDTVKTVTDIIMGRITIDEIMMTPGMDNLHIITSGNIPPNPAELIESNRLKEFIEEAEKEYDIILFDSTPVLSAADAAILGTKVDGVLIVYRVGEVSRGLLKRTSNQLEQVNCNIIGVILNGMKPDISPDFQDYKYYKYYSYYGEEDKGERHKKRLWPFSLGKGGGHEGLSPRDESFPLNGDAALHVKERKRVRPFLRGSLMIVALLFLTIGILWQNGIIEPERLLNRTKSVHVSDKKAPVSIKSPIETAEKESPAIPVKSGVMEDTGPVKAHDITPEKAVSQPNSLQEEKQVIGPAEYKYQPESYPYSIALGSFRTRERAGQALIPYEQKGLSPIVVKVNLKEKGEWYRVYAGHFRDEGLAQRTIQDYGLPEAVVRKTAYANLIGIYRKSNELDSMIQSAKELGYSPYTIKIQDDRSALFIGAFMTREGAQEQNRKLRSEGIPGQVVKR